MSDPSVLSDRSNATNLALGIVLGLLLGYVTTIVVVVIILGPLLGLGLAFAGLRDGRDGRALANVGSGLLIGMGILYLFGALNTLNACQGQDVCGGASAMPFLYLAVAIVAVGLVLEGITVARAR